MRWAMDKLKGLFGHTLGIYQGFGPYLLKTELTYSTGLPIE